MRILITGSSGQLGAEVARQLAGAHELVGLDRVPGAWTQHVGSLLDRGLVDTLVPQVDAVIHIAALHAAHLAGASRQAFVDTNITGTLTLLEAAAGAGLRRFVYTSTTSVYGAAMEPHDRAVWVTEDLVPQPRDIYDITKLAAEALCRHFAEALGLPAICLRTSRFFPEAPDLLATYRLYRGADVRDIARAHVLAVTNTTIPFDVFNISARSPFAEADMSALWADAPCVIRRHYPQADQIFARHGWTLPPRIDRVYVIAKAERILGYQPVHNFTEVLAALDAEQV